MNQTLKRLIICSLIILSTSTTAISGEKRNDISLLTSFSFNIGSDGEIFIIAPEISYSRYFFSYLSLGFGVQCLYLWGDGFIMNRYNEGFHFYSFCLMSNYYFSKVYNSSFYVGLNNKYIYEYNSINEITLSVNIGYRWIVNNTIGISLSFKGGYLLYENETSKLRQSNGNFIYGFSLIISYLF